ncbi:unnamed protein product [Zymoseptoria tritici ST99CH_3D7]|uniref:NAD(P)-binding protein n=1 Tax=Zymoseptoria tritici (strain ST99CH_3D7) TaxID=1276538 RepID=A0A1X7S060_ZYMT9|nr:unnamed protein product [Zymoseptoria tritici ST99CH_3D7]
MATQFYIEEKDYASLKDQVVVLTGGASGIGLATTKVLLSVGAKVVSGDINEPPLQHSNLTFLTTDVTSWDSLLSLFDLARSKHGDIHHIFANAGISGRANYLESLLSPTTGKLLEPPTLVYDINLRGMLNTAYIGLHHLRTQSSKPTTGSLVLTASGSSFLPFGVTDYTTTKHAVLGFQRGLLPNLIEQNLPIRVNAIGPSWTETGLVPKELCQAAGIESQSADVVGRQVCVLMADGERQGQFIYSAGGRNYEIEQSVLLPAAVSATGGVEVQEQEAYERLKKLAANFGVDKATKERQVEVAKGKEEFVAAQ